MRMSEFNQAPAPRPCILNRPSRTIYLELATDVPACAPSDATLTDHESLPIDVLDDDANFRSSAECDRHARSCRGAAVCARRATVPPIIALTVRESTGNSAGVGST
jgi:hypothetical protein